MKYIAPIIQKYIDDNTIKNYYEPFVGGANVIDKIKCENRTGSDLNKYLIALLTHVRDNGEGGLYDTVTRDLYNKTKNAVKYNDTQNLQIGKLAISDF